MPTETKLIDQIARQASQPASPAIHALTDRLLADYGAAIEAILFYGSCLRTGEDRGGLVDLYVLVNRYRAIEHRYLLAALNKLLPPNVFYIEVPFEDRIVRAKYAVLSLDDFRAGATRWFHSYIWGRFAQPVGLIYARNNQIVERIQSILGQAVLRFVTRVLPRMPVAFTTRELWQSGWTLSYRAELRAERPEKLAGLFAAAPHYYEQLTRTVLENLPYPFEIQNENNISRFKVSVPLRLRRISRLDWMVRSWQGKLLSALRLLKGLMTFRGGIDYILWKIERHSGIRVEVPAKLKRYPLLATCVVFWRLYRQGAYR
ncbi:MAG: hypothetical protein R3274_05440 [Desulfobacterales bacterium]|nr:hypothetical protein [Desulfobacterales bacterium]